MAINNAQATQVKAAIKALSYLNAILPELEEAGAFKDFMMGGIQDADLDTLYEGLTVNALGNAIETGKDVLEAVGTYYIGDPLGENPVRSALMKIVQDEVILR